MGGTGFEPVVDATAETEVPQQSGAKSGAFSPPAARPADAPQAAGDPDLMRLLATWPRLTDDDRLAVIEHAERLALEEDAP